jgi:branched-chain amino acid aminotransferase
MTAPRIVYHDGAFLPIEDVQLAPTLQGLNYGTGVFEGIRAYRCDDGVLAVFRAADHCRRLLESAAALRIDVGLDVHELVGVTVELLGRNGRRDDSYVRPLAYKQALEPGTRFGVGLRGVSSALSVVDLPMADYLPAGGLRCAVSTVRRTPSSAIPSSAKVTGGYVNNALAADQAHHAGYDDAIMLNHRGQVAEASTANVFVVRRGEVTTPDPGADILAGITRATVIELLDRELEDADEILLTGTGCQIAPVVQLNGRAVGAGSPGPLTMRLRSRYEDAVRGRIAAYHHWLTPVPMSLPRIRQRAATIGP